MSAKKKKRARRSAIGRTKRRATAKRKAVSGKAKRRRAPIVKKAARISKALKIIGRERIKPGPILIGSTRFRGLSRKSFNVLRRELSVIRSATREGLRIVTYQLRVKAPDGRLLFSGDRIIVPTKAVRRVARIMREKGVSETEAVRRVLIEEIQKAVFARIDEEIFPDYREGRARGAAKAYLKGGASRVLKKLESKHRALGFTFSVRFTVEI